MVFSSAKEFKWAVQYHEAMRQKDVLFKKNEGRRVRVICRHNQICQWSIFGSRSNPDSPFTVKTYNNVHTCGNQDENKLVTSGFLAKVYKDEFRVNKEWGRGPFQEHVKSKFHCQLTRNQAYLAKKKALRQIDGLDSEQFNELNDYCEELRRNKCARFTAYKSVDEIYQVDDENFKPFKVDLSARQCSCRKWDLSGIPCTHAIAAIRKKGDLPKHHVHDCYTVEHYLRSYGPAILPIRAKELWHKTTMPPPLPPKYKPQPGRPKMKRMIQLWRSQIRKRQPKKVTIGQPAREKANRYKNKTVKVYQNQTPMWLQILMFKTNSKMWIGKVESRQSVFNRLGASPKEVKRKSMHERLGPVAIIKKHTKSPLGTEPSKEIKRAVPSRMRREADVNVLCGEVLKIRLKIIVHTSMQEENEENMEENEENMESSYATYQNGKDVEAPKNWRVIAWS
nr:Zinc knuckle family protein [Ipomoea batatas]